MLKNDGGKFVHKNFERKKIGLKKFWDLETFKTQTVFKENFFPEKCCKNDLGLQI